MDEALLRTEMLLGEAAMEKLQGSHVAVLGLGGVGSWCAEALARSGVGRLTVADCDDISRSNLNRQLEATLETVGRSKAQAMAERIRLVSPCCKVQALDYRYTPEDREVFFSAGEYDYIVDAIDLVSCKLDLIETALARGIPILSALGTGNKVDPKQFQITDISKTMACPLARVVRKELKNRGILHHRVLWSAEQPRKPEEREAPPPGRRTVPGSVAWVPSCAGLMMAGDVVLTLVGQDPDYRL